MANCYSLHLGAININYSDAPCEDVTQAGHNVTCCVRGSTCMSNGICKNTNGDGHYTADCTDPTLQDPHCQNHCGQYSFCVSGDGQDSKLTSRILGRAGGLAGSQITYNSTSGLWACCSYDGGVPNCSEPTDELFAAPGPSNLKTVLYLPKTGTISYSTSAATATSVSNTSTSSVSSSSSSTVSPGTAAGIGAGVGVGIFLIGLVIAFVIFKRRKSTAMTTTTNITPDTSLFYQQHVLRELDNKPVVSEMDTGRSLPELASHF
ncbi:uncharacterized protein N7477_004429 [Penicillium maclennaniae]|uniref:uncharacterized protein n=1 Tax=Penicillium maclennaniae TaxID=1343394 RepID=UPI00253FC06B|nr:uncharacterized protein N7477_004429 [Penicillium maclennaniae]KAJ5674495.1 hypothetical protein N7477_004429 [Penicillium maclennaniae]